MNTAESRTAQPATTGMVPSIPGCQPAAHSLTHSPACKPADRARPARPGLGTLIRPHHRRMAAVIGLLVVLPVLVQGLPAS